MNAQITNLTPKTASPFNVSAQLPGGGSLAAQGNMGPFNQQNNAATPLDANVSLKHVELATSGVLPPDAGISGLADLQAADKVERPDPERTRNSDSSKCQAGEERYAVVQGRSWLSSRWRKMNRQ